MSRTVVVVLATTRQPLPAGISHAGQYSFSIGAGIPDQVANGKEATFSSVPPGDYVATVQGVDSDGAPLGSAVTASFTVPDDVAEWDAPASLVVTVGDAGA